MSTTSKKAILWITDALILIITLVVFFADSHFLKTALDFAGIFFVLLSEAALFFGILRIVTRVKNNLILQSGVPCALLVYWVITIVTTALFKAVFGNHPSGFIITQIVIVILAFSAIFGMIRAGTKSHENQKNIVSENILQSCQETLLNLYTGQKNTQYAKQLNDLYEAIKYSDKTASITDKELEISSQIQFLAGILPQANEKELAGLFEHVLLLIKQRNQLVLQSKKGSC